MTDDPRAPYAVGVRNGQIAHISGSGHDPLVNIVDRGNVIVGGVHSEALARRIVALLNGSPT